jgi:dipeptidase E
MPIVQPPSFDSFGLIPFQINPHYVDPDPASTHMGETREKRIEQFLEENDVPVLGMREGAWLRRQGSMVTLGGTTGARLFRRGVAPAEFTESADLSFLLDAAGTFDSAIAGDPVATGSSAA